MPRYNLCKIVFCHLENVGENVRVFDLYLLAPMEKEMWEAS